MAQHVERAVEVELDADEVWELLVDDAERAGWFGGETSLEPVPGGTGTFTDPDGTRRGAVVDDVEPGRRLAWTWWPEEGGAASQVRIDLSPVPGGTRIAVTERPLAAAQASVSTPATATGTLVELEHRCLLRASMRATC